MITPPSNRYVTGNILNVDSTLIHHTHDLFRHALKRTKEYRNKTRVAEMASKKRVPRYAQMNLLEKAPEVAKGVVRQVGRQVRGKDRAALLSTA
ncbi:hypothetical protein HPP92_023413 [Vanilla planifolia]|uniref:Uncharacterized protein n=1 Tax=Vanilla planifolia TaxID=51239 RepID=A0A835PQA5_VANPL|nr:hypothetical protein HPP92_023413 [Vanilla planifolia]